MRALKKSTAVAVTAFSLLLPAMAVIAQEGEDRRVPLDPEITYERVVAEADVLRIAETPPAESPVIFA